MTNLTSDEWLNEFDDLERSVEETTSLIRELNRLKMKGSSNAAQSSKIRKNLKVIQDQFEKLQSSLEKMAQSRNSYGLVEEEVRRRKNDLNKMKIKIEQANNESTKGGTTTTQQSQIAFGETEVTQNMTNNEIYNHQQDVMKKQDDSLDLLSNTIRKQKEIGNQIGEELDVHSKLIDDITRDTDRVDHKLTHQTGRIEKLMHSTRARWLFLCICLLIIILVILGSTHWGKDIWG
ncbi:syntaxin-51-related [Anaeramoeba ignava]|uniref:Syntaxin-51-related n=1 Tax=Anaeramoeba ignava TaxID=1746090 RepID=A0A9Q0R968_ANAIG|nr:syntaxin-51-related [Anaeramoeba ignava]